MTRLWHWVLAGLALPAVLVGGWLVLALVLGMSPADVLAGAGYSLYLVAFLTLPCTAALTVVGLGVLAVAPSLPPRGRPARAVAIALTTLATAVVTTAAATLLVVGPPSGAGTSWPSVIANGAVLALVPTALALVALLRWRPRAAAEPAAPAVSPPAPPAPAPGRR
ncbi:hypothetical protein [Cellulomonas endometrii]|uniref:hypothetical protein n=1 Tax=Cellulomonas endometrii TaxID=3036301 RepID=UPI0024AE3174|nr:hypothetical protein [Cellulomonas endometrii]